MRLLGKLNRPPSLSNKHILVTGGTGFIGNWVVHEAVERGYKVTVMSRHHASSMGDLIKGVSYVRSDLSAAKSVADALRETEKVTHVINLGGDIDHAQYLDGGRRIIETHLMGVCNLVNCLDWSDLECFVQIGTSDEYGNLPAPQRENYLCEPISSYSLAKLAATQFLQMLNRTEEFPVIILRLFLVYGPGQGMGRFIPQLIYACLNDEVFPASKAEQLRDFCFIADVVKGIFSAMDSPETTGEVYNLASGSPTTVRSVIEAVVSTIGGGKANYGALPYRTGENMKLYADIDKARDAFNWNIDTDMQEGLRQTINYYKNGL